MNEDLIITLQNYWFSEKEAKVYLTALSMWAAPASSIARNANESRTTVYSVLWDLVKKWYCSTVVRENVTYFSAVDPEMLVKIQEQKYQKIKEKLPEFMAIWSMLWWHSKIKTFEWKNALKNMFIEFATTEVDPKFFQWNFEIKSNKTLFPVEELNYYISERIRKWLTTYRILTNKNRTNQEEESLKDSKKLYKRQTIIAKDFNIDIKSSIYMYWPNKVCLLIFDDEYPQVLIIENAHLYDFFIKIFEYIRNINKIS